MYFIYLMLFLSIIFINEFYKKGIWTTACILNVSYIWKKMYEIPRYSKFATTCKWLYKKSKSQYYQFLDDKKQSCITGPYRYFKLWSFNHSLEFSKIFSFLCDIVIIHPDSGLEYFLWNWWARVSIFFVIHIRFHLEF